MTLPLFAGWLSDPAWLAMDATVRGLHAQLLLIAAAHQPAGVLPDDDRQWRQWLGLPLEAASAPTSPVAALLEQLQPPVAAPAPKRGKGKGAPLTLPDSPTQPLAIAAVAHLEQAFQNGAGAVWGEQQVWLDALWRQRWKPQLERAWERIDAALIAQHPSLVGQEGAWFHPLSLALKGPLASGTPSLAAAAASATPAPPRPTPKSAQKKTKATKPSTWRVPPHPLDREGEPTNEAWLAMGLANEPWRDAAFVLSHWRVPLSPDRQKTLWDLGVHLLSSSPTEAIQARAFLGKLIRAHGEREVARALSDLSLRALQPADGKSFLQAMMRRQGEGTEAQQMARHARAKVAL